MAVVEANRDRHHRDREHNDVGQGHKDSHEKKHSLSNGKMTTDSGDLGDQKTDNGLVNLTDAIDVGGSVPLLMKPQLLDPTMCRCV